MIVLWATRDVDGKTCNGFEYSFLDIAMKNYVGQDNVQVAAVVEEISGQIQQQLLDVRNIIFQSNNASCLTSQELIPFVYYLNAESQAKNYPIIRRWIYTEAETGRGRLNTHFSYMNVWFKSFVEDGNNIVNEDDIVQALAFHGDIAGSTAILFNAMEIPNKCIEGSKFKTKNRESCNY